MKKYWIVTGTDPDKVSDLINGLLAKGWGLRGKLTVTHGAHEGNGILYTQVCIRETPPDVLNGSGEA